MTALNEEAELELYSAFEQEFVYTGVEDHPGAPYSLEFLSTAGIFAEVFVAAMRAAGIGAGSFLPEYGARQYEVTTGPATGITAADNAIKVREMARAAAHRLGHRAVFSPILDPHGTGNGVHIHISLRTGDGRPATHDDFRPYGLTTKAEAFMAGVLTHVRRWPRSRRPIRSPTSGSPQPLGTDLGVSCRPRSRGQPAGLSRANLPGFDGARQFNIEFRPADAAASPYLALGAIVWAGVDGLKRPRPADRRATSRRYRRKSAWPQALPNCRTRWPKPSTFWRQPRRRRTGSAR